MAENTSESRDGTGAGDHDQPFHYGTPEQYLPLRALVRLTLLRTALRNGERAGDTESGPWPIDPNPNPNPNVEDVPLG